MKRQLSPDKKCNSCGSIIEHEKEQTICDFCGIDIEWNSKSGYPFTIDPIFHDESRHDDWHFCTFEHGMKWIARGNFYMSNDDDFFSMYIHKEDVLKLREILLKGKILEVDEKRN